MSSTSSREELESAFKKAAKSLDGEKRGAVKKAKGTKGKKAKETIAAVEQEFANKLKELQAKHEKELKDLESGGGNGGEEEPPTSNEAVVPQAAPIEEAEQQQQVEEPPKALSEKERKQEKARRKKERQKEKEAQQQKELEEEEANAGPSNRLIEMEQIESVLTPLNLKVAEVEADGHCLYRAVAAQAGGDRDYEQVRSLCAETLIANEEEFSPFCEYTDAITSFDQYVDRVRSSAEWGGHLELRALGMALDRPIQVYSMQSGNRPLCIHDEGSNDGEKKPILLSYHLHYYALGEHYNQVITK